MGEEGNLVFEVVLTVKQKVIFHLEAFVAKFMRLYEGYVIHMRPSLAITDHKQELDGHGHRL